MKTTRKLNKNTIKPVINYVKNWENSIMSINTQGSKFYHFTLDYYNNRASFTGGYAYDLDSCYNYLNNQPFDKYALDMTTGNIYDLDNKQIIMKVKLNSKGVK